MASESAADSRKRSRDQQNGGYDYDFVDTIPSKYICSICSKVLRDAHLTGCCGQHFCASCLTHWLRTQQRRKTCPHCRQENFQHITNKERIREVNELKIHCTNHSEGCGWVGELEGLQSHLDSDKGCGYAEVTCTNRGCRERVSRKDFQIHLQEKCYYRPYECEHCGHKDTYTAITGGSANLEYHHLEGHYLDCPMYPLDCPNECGVAGIRRRAIPDHHSSCPLETLDCPFMDAGCTEKIVRKDMEDHMTANQEKHVLVTFQSLQNMKWSISKEIDSLEESIRHNTNTPESTAQSLRRMKYILQGSLHKVGDTMTFRVTDFSQLRKEKKVWHSPPFSIGDKVSACLEVYPCGVGRGEGSHVSVSLILIEKLQKEQYIVLEYNVLVTAIGQCIACAVTHKTLELCTIIPGESILISCIPWCSAHLYPCPSPGGVLESEEQFLEAEEANSILTNNSMILKLKLQEHHHHWEEDSGSTSSED